MLLTINHLRTLRESAGLSQTDISHLLCYQESSQVSHLEKGSKTASLRTAFAYQILFRISPAGLYPRMFREVEESIRFRAGTLITELEKRNTGLSCISRIAVLQDIERGGIAKKRPIFFEDMRDAHNTNATYE